METYFNFLYLFKSPDFLRILFEITDYPNNVVNFESDLAKIKDKSKAISLEDYLLYAVWDQDIEAMSFYQINENKVSFLINPKKVTLENVVKKFNKKGLVVNELEQEKVKAKYGIVRF